MGKALYRTYRSRTLSEVVGQEHITDTLTTALKKGLISHAYLFTGPKGVGKTSVARILAHEINQLPYDDDSMHLDIIEIDAASNRRIDEIRDLRDKVHISPTSAKFKVYIIDEVHMLTREAFNALLKTLEEPPAHVVFILATTEVHKLPDTIVSRTQRFAFRPISMQKVADHLRQIAKQEKLKISDDALLLLAEHGGGSFRDSISVLDQMRGLGREVNAEDVVAMLGIAPSELIHSLLQAVEQHDAPGLIDVFNKLRLQGAEPARIAKQFSELLRARFITKQQTLSHEQTINLLTKLLDVPTSSDPGSFLELVLLDVALPGQSSASPPVAAAASVAPPPSVTAKPHTPVGQTKSPEQPKVSKPTAREEKTIMAGDEGFEPTIMEPEPTVVPPTQSSPQTGDSSNQPLDAAIWPQVLAAIKKKYNTLYSILRMAKPSFAPGTVTLEVGFAFHQKRLNETRNKQIIAELIEQITGQSVQIMCELGEAPAEAQGPALPPAEASEVSHSVPAAKDSSGKHEPPEQSASEEVVDDYYVKQAEEASARPLDTVNNIFGGGELMES